MTEYIIKKFYEHNCFTYYNDTGYIGLKMSDVVLSNNELLEYISDGLTHEHIHKILNELFNYTVSRLFDGIEYYFRNHLLHEKQIRKHNQLVKPFHKYETYKTFIKEKGYDAFLDYYSITQKDMIQANKICRDRLYKIDLNQAKNVTWKKLKEQ